MKRDRSQPFAFSFAFPFVSASSLAGLALAAFAGAGCAHPPRDASDALKGCADPGGFCRVAFAGGDESACYRLKSGELACETVAQGRGQGAH
jgi:hypothetical protein